MFVSEGDKNFGSEIMKSIFLLSLFVVLGYGAPKSKIKTHYDQKQTGDYNIRLSLKDFQIIALLGDDTIGDIGVSFIIPLFNDFIY